MAEMKTLTGGSTTYEIVDAQARQNMFHAYRIDMTITEEGYVAENVDFFDALAEKIRSGENVIVCGRFSTSDGMYGYLISVGMVLVGTMIVVVFQNTTPMQCTIASDGSVTVMME